MVRFLSDLVVPAEPHLFLSGLATLWVFSAAVSAMSAPEAKSGPGYQWLYRFAHLLAANLDRAGLLNAAPAPVPDEPLSK